MKTFSSDRKFSMKQTKPKREIMKLYGKDFNLESLVIIPNKILWDHHQLI